MHRGCTTPSNRSSHVSLLSFTDSGVPISVELRLVNGSTHCNGRVEVFHNDTWAALCDHGWGMAEAQVVCRQLGCGEALLAPVGSHFGQGSGQMWPGNINCTGSESALFTCKTKQWSNSTCHPWTSAGVVCAGNHLGNDTGGVMLGSSP